MLIDIIASLVLAKLSNENTTKGLSKVWLINKLSATLIIPIDIARKHGLAEPSHVVVEEHPEGILIKKLLL
ncbi:MAG: hypothetical protein ACR2IS_10515 [Nitrososphaeraceae archaeon]